MTMLPRLEASETMEAALATALGTGNLSKTETRRTMNDLRKKTRAPRTRAPARAARTSADMLAYMGIEAVTVKPGGSGDG